MITHKKYIPRKHKNSQNYSNDNYYQNKSKPITCYNCGKAGHTSNRCKSKRKNKINEIIDDLSGVEITTKENLKERLQIYSEINKISDNDDFYNSSSSNNSDKITCACKQLNMIKGNTVRTNNSKSKELIFDMIQQIPDQEKQKEHLEKLKTLIINEEDEKDNLLTQPFSISKLFETYPINTSLKTKPKDIHEIQVEIKQLKEEIQHIKEDLQHVKTKNLANETQMCIIQHNINKGKEIAIEEPPFSLNEITISTTEPSNSKFISVIKGFNYQKWFILITLAVNNSKVTFTAMIDSGADHSVIKDGIFPTKYYEPTNEKLVTANNSPLKVMGKLTRITICNEKIYFKHQFIIVDNLNTDVILGIPFLTQIYPFWTDPNGLGTNIIGQKILFKFITPTQYKELSTLQTNSIYQSINLIQTK